MTCCARLLLPEHFVLAKRDAHGALPSCYRCAAIPHGQWGSAASCGVGISASAVYARYQIGRRAGVELTPGGDEKEPPRGQNLRGRGTEEGHSPMRPEVIAAPSRAPSPRVRPSCGHSSVERR